MLRTFSSLRLDSEWLRNFGVAIRSVIDRIREDAEEEEITGRGEGPRRTMEDGGSVMKQVF